MGEKIEELKPMIVEEVLEGEIVTLKQMTLAECTNDYNYYIINEKGYGEIALG